MTIELSSKPINIMRRDNDGYIYAIPSGLVDDFTYKVEAITNADWNTDEWQRAVDELEAEYGCYRKD